MVSYSQISNANLDTAIALLGTRQVEPERIISIFYAGSNYVIVYSNPM